ncbi:MAG: hypothetical protein ACREAW_04425, partial [Nitrososphaera sp.]
ASWYDCSFEYKERVYDISFILSRPVEITGNGGLVPVSITPESVSENSIEEEKTVYEQFNNTIVWINKLDSWVTVSVNYTDVVDEGENSEIRRIPPGGLLDLYLAADWHDDDSKKDRVDDRIYSYKIVEYPSISGTIRVADRYVIGEGIDSCYSKEEASSLYSQSGFAVSFPSYIPDGFSPVCYKTGNGGWLIQVYSNRAAADNIRILEDPDTSRFMLQVKEKGIIVIHASKDPTIKWNSTAYERFQNMVANSILPQNSQFYVMDGNSVMAYSRGDVSNVDIHIGEEDSYHIEGKVAVDELLKMAKSLYKDVSVDEQ